MKYLSFKEGKTMIYVIVAFQLILIGIILSLLLQEEKFVKAITIGIIYFTVLFVVGKFLLKIHKVKSILFDDEKYYIDSKDKSYLKSDLVKIRNNFLAASYIEFKNGDRYYFLRKPPLKTFKLID
tara:strand:- start:58 stop:432 length:375 start_codon:yes stop_codon:yes gene_type:complete